MMVRLVFLLVLLVPAKMMAYRATSTSFILDDGATGTISDSGTSSTSFQLRSYRTNVGQNTMAGTLFSALGEALSYDISAPLTGSVADGPGADIDWHTSSTSAQANWSGFSDPESGITEYEYTLQRTSSSTYWNAGTNGWGSIVWNSTGLTTSTSISHANLALTTGDFYQFCVRATNGASLRSTPTCSDGFGLTPSTEIIVPSGVSFGNFVNPGSLNKTVNLPITVTANAYNGYNILVAKSGSLSSTSSSIPDISDTGCTSTGVAWPGSGFGFTSDSLVDSNKFSSGTLYCQLPTEPTYVTAANRSGPLGGTASAQTDTLTLRSQISSTQAAGSYQTTVLIRLVPTY